MRGRYRSLNILGLAFPVQLTGKVAGPERGSGNGKGIFQILPIATNKNLDKDKRAEI